MPPEAQAAARDVSQWRRCTRIPGDDSLASNPAAAPGSVLGPFHTAGSPWLNDPAKLNGANEGERVLLHGRACGTRGEPLPNAMLDFR